MSEDQQFAESVVNNEESLQDLAWAIDMNQGEFSLILARCNYVSVRETLTQRLREICPVEIHEIVLEPPITTIYTTIRENLGDIQPPAVMVLGLESLNNLEQLLTSMNVAREEFRKYCPFPLVLWINDEISQKLIRLAPDFYSWATLNVFEITADILSDRLEQQTDALFTNGLELGDSQLLQNGTVLDCVSFLEVQTAWRDLQSQEKEINPALQASLEFALGREAYVKGQIDNALVHYQHSLTFWQQNNNLLRQGLLLFYIGFCHYRRAYLAHTDNHTYWQKAKLNFQQCIEVFELEQRPDLVAKFISPLGEVLRQLQEWEVLEDLATKSQQLHTNYGTQTQLAQDYGFLAEIALCRKDAEQARAKSEMALEILASNTPEEKLQQQGLYLLLLARSLSELGQIEEAVKKLEIAKSEDPQDNPRLYIQILAELRSLYFEQRQYLQAFEIKQARRSLEQQFGFQAFIGAGRLQPQRQTRTAISHTIDQEIIAEEIVASGRQRDITRLIERIGTTQHKLTVIHGQSGVGKSSLVNAGLVPALKLQTIGTRDVLPIALRVYTDWIKELGKILADALKNKELYLSSSFDSVTNIVNQLTENSECNLLTVLIFDQFEEFFFVCKEASQRLEFFDFLGDCLNIPDVKIVLSMREDYLHYLLICNSLPKMTAINKDILSKNVLYPLGNFLPEDAKDFIKGRSQLNLEPALIDELVQDLACELGEVRPIELQVVGAQMQTENITTLEKYRQLGPKERLVQRYLEEIIKDCGEENQQIAQILLYLLTDENNTRPLKTKADLEKDLKALASDLVTESHKLGLVLKIFVESGLVFLLPENPTNRYQLVHDYLVVFIRRQQEPQLSKLIAELETERKQRQLSEEQLKIVEDTNEKLNQLIAELENEKKQRNFSEKQVRILEQANQLLAEAQQKAKGERLKRNNWHKLQMLLASVSFAGFVTILRFVGLLQSSEWGAFDQYVRWRPQEPRDNRIVIVGIDETDLNNFTYPLTDQALAKLLNKLKARQPRAIGLNIYRDLPVEPGYQELVKVFKSTPNLVGIQKVVGEQKSETIAPPSVLKALGQVGMNDLIIDEDGKVRRGLIYVNTKDGETVYSISLHLALHYLEKEGITATKDFQIGKTKFIPFESNDGGYVRADAGGYQTLINYRGKSNSFDTVSMTDIMEDKVPADWGRDRIILIGYTGESLKDSFFIPYSSELLSFSKQMSGVEIHANITSQIISAALEGRSGIKTLPKAMEILLIFGWSGIGVLLIWRFSFWQTSTTSIIVASITLTIISYLAFLYAWWLPVIPPLLALLGAATTATIVNKDQLEKLQLSRTLELIVEAYHQNPDAGRRAIEYFVISNKGTKLVKEDITRIIINTLKTCNSISDITAIVDQLSWISFSSIKEGDLMFITKFMEISRNLQDNLNTNLQSPKPELIQISIAILQNMLIDIDSYPQNRQITTFKFIIKKWLAIFNTVINK